MAITKYSVDDYEEMVRLGVLTEKDRVELIRGEIVPKMAIGPRHSACVKSFNRILTLRSGDRAIVGCQDPIRLPDSEPEPDISLVRPPARARTSLPFPA
jgi:hypothetical protein